MSLFMSWWPSSLFDREDCLLKEFFRWQAIYKLLKNSRIKKYLYFLLLTNTKCEYFSEGSCFLKKFQKPKPPKTNKTPNKPASDTKSKVVLIAIVFQKTLNCLPFAKVRFMSGSILEKHRIKQTAWSSFHIMPREE